VDDFQLLHLQRTQSGLPLMRTEPGKRTTISLSRPGQRLRQLSAEPWVSSHRVGEVSIPWSQPVFEDRGGGLSSAILDHSRCSTLNLYFWDTNSSMYSIGIFCVVQKVLGGFSVLFFLRMKRTKLSFSVKPSRPERL
jgi:hypothetical protein